jgi:membrane associated rhomboid family serine protease
MTWRLTPAVKVLCIAFLAAFVVQQTADQFFGAQLQGWLALVPSGVVLQGRVWQLFTYAFLHGDVLHLFLNLMMLVFIGSEIEGYFFFCSTFAGLLYLIFQVFAWGGAGLHIPMVGASGGIYGLLLAYGLMFGERTLLFMMVFPMKGKHFIWVLAGIELFTTVFSGRSGSALSALAHLGGMAAGFGYLWAKAAWSVSKKRREGGIPGLSGKLARKVPSKKKKASHLKLVSSKDRDDDPDDAPPSTWH